MEITEKLQLFRQISLLNILSNEEAEKLSKLAVLKKISKFQFIFMPDEPTEFVYILVKGRVKCGTFSADGREVIKEILKPFAIFGDLGLAGVTQHADFTQALYDDAEYLMIRTTDFQTFLQGNKAFMSAFLFHLTKKLNKLEDRLSSLILKDARERIIDFLLETAGNEGKRVGYETLVKHHLTQQDIANLTGTSRQTVTSVLNELRKNNLIYFNRNTILIRDLDKLA